MRLADAARRYGARVTVDLSTAHGIAELGRDEMRRRVAALAPDVVFANEAEAAAFGEPLDCTLGRQARRARLHRAARRRDRRRTRRLAVERVVDTTGAGDAFAAGFVLERDLADAVQRGQAAAARCVTLVGALP